MSTDGFLLGKFYPPHAGHHHLIDEAAKRCDHLTVLVLGHPDESISIDDRVSWLRDRHPVAGHWNEPCVHVVGLTDPHPVDYDDPDVWQLHIDLIVNARRVGIPLVRRPDIVFGSERYVPELARRLNHAFRYAQLHRPDCPDIEPVIVDLDRKTVPISGTKVRADPRQYWWALAPATRAGLTKRVVLMGAESSGTTTLTRELAAHYGTVWVPEYGRYFSEAVGRNYDWRSKDFELIAREQQRQEDELARRAGPIMFCDTDALATTVFHRQYMGGESAEIARIAAERLPDLYIVTDHGHVAWEDDGTRANPDDRAWMTDGFWDAAWAAAWDSDRPFSLAHFLVGSHRNRTADAIDLCDKLLADGWHFNDPLG